MSKQSIPSALTGIAILAILGCGHNIADENGKAFGYQEKTLPARFQDEATNIHETFRIQNRFHKSVRLETVSTSCTCTSARFDRAQLEPGDSTQLQLDGDWSRRAGPIEMACEIQTDVGQSWSCKVRATIYKRVECVPEQASFGSLNPRAEATKTLVISTYSRGEIPAEPRIELSRSFETFELQIGSSRIEVLEDGVQVRRVPIVLTFKPTNDETVGPQSAMIVAAVGGRTHEHRIEVPIYWAVQSPFLVSPPRVFFGDVANPGSLSTSITIKRADGRPFRITEVSSSHPAFRGAAHSRTTATEHTISVDLDAQAVERFAFGKLSVQIAECDTSVTVPLAAVRHRRDAGEGGSGRPRSS